MGLHRAGFEVVGVDIKPQPHYPFEFYQADALLYPLDGYDVYWASPPCQAYMPTNKYGQKQTKHPRLIEPVRERLQATGKPYIIENIYRAPLKANLMLCGTMFGLRVIRHRYFECSFPPPLTRSCNHWGQVARGEFVGVYARGGRGPRRGAGRRDGAPLTSPITAEEAMGIAWMTRAELTQAIPPAYAEFLGKYLMAYLTKEPEMLGGAK